MAKRFFYERAPKTAALGLLDMYSLGRRGRVMGLQCDTFKLEAVAKCVIQDVGYGLRFLAF